MATIDVLDSHGATIAVEKPLTPGRKADTASRPVVLSTEDAALLTAIVNGVAPLAAFVDGLEALVNAPQLGFGYGFAVSVTAATTAVTYSIGDIVGGLLTFGVSRVNDEAVIINEVIINSKIDLATTNWELVLFSADPNGSPRNNDLSYALVAADAFKVRRTLVAADFTRYDHGTPNTWVAKNLNIVCKPAAGTTNVFALLIDRAGITLTSTTDIQVTLAGTGA